MTKAAAIASFFLLFSVSAMAQGRAVEIDKFRATGLKENKDVFVEFKTSKAGAATFYTSVAGLWVATAIDIQSGNHLDKTHYQEANLFGSTGGQITTSAVTTGAAFILRRYGGRHTRWIATALVAGAATGHAYGAAHNYGLK